MRPTPPAALLDRAAVTLAVLVLALALLMNQAAVHERVNIVDSYLFEYHGWCAARGAIPYVDFWDNKPPGIWVANALAFQLLGEQTWTGRVPAAIALALALVAFVAGATQLYGRSITLPAALIGGALLTHVGFECGANRTETYVVACELLGIMLYLQARSRVGPKLWLAGVLLGCAPWFKQVGVAALLACLIHTLSTQRASIAWRRGAALLLAASLPSAAIVAWLASRGALEEALFAITRFNRAYFAVNDATWWELHRTIWDYRATFPLLVVPVLLALLGLILPFSNARSVAIADAGLPETDAARPLSPCGAGAQMRGSLVLLLTWLLVAFYLANVGVGRVSHHLMPMLPALALLALRPAAWLMREGLHRALQTPAKFFGLLCFTAACMQIFGQSVRSGGWISRDGQLQWPPANAAIRNQIAQGQAIAQLAAGEPVYVWGWAPGPYRYAYCLPSTRFATLEKVHPLRPHADFIERETRAALLARPPRVFAASRADFTSLIAADTPLAALLRERYEERTEIDSLVVLVLRRPAPPTSAARDGAAD